MALKKFIGPDGRIVYALVLFGTPICAFGGGRDPRKVCAFCAHVEEDNDGLYCFASEFLEETNYGETTANNYCKNWTRR